LTGERDVFDIDVHRVDEALFGRSGDQLFARDLDPGRSVELSGHRVAREQRDPARLGNHVGQASSQTGLPQLGLDRQAVTRLELDGRGAVPSRLRQQRHAELDHLFVRRIGEEPRAPIDAPLPVQVPIGPARPACLELVRAPTDERKVRVAIHEAGHDRARDRFGLSSVAGGGPRILDQSVAPGDDGVLDPGGSSEIGPALGHQSGRR
jgi:hypothetical protein